MNLVVAVICESLIQISRAPGKEENASTMSLYAEDDDDADAPGNQSLEVMMRRMLKNQVEMAGAIRELQEDMKVLKGRKAPKRTVSISHPLTVDVPFFAAREPAVKQEHRIEIDGADSEKVQDGEGLVPRPPERSPVVEYQVSLEGSELHQRPSQLERKDSSGSDLPRDYVAMLRGDTS